MNRLEYESVSFSELRGGDGDRGGQHESVRSSSYQPPPLDPIMSSEAAAADSRASMIQQQQQQKPHDEELIVVETVDSRESEEQDAARRNTNNQSTPRPVRLVLMCMPQTQKQAIQCSMTLFFLLLLLGLFFSFVVIQKYRLVIGTIWMVLIVMFVMFVYVVQHHANSPGIRKHGIFHQSPFLAAAAELISKEFEDFKQDWREQVLLLTYENTEQHPDSGEHNPTEYAAMDEGEKGATLNTSRNQKNQRGSWGRNKKSSSTKLESADSAEEPRQPKSRIFRFFVKPVLPLIRKKRNKKDNNSQQQQQPQEVEMRGAQV